MYLVSIWLKWFCFVIDILVTSRTWKNMLKVESIFATSVFVNLVNNDNLLPLYQKGNRNPTKPQWHTYQVTFGDRLVYEPFQRFEPSLVDLWSFDKYSWIGFTIIWIITAAAEKLNIPILSNSFASFLPVAKDAHTKIISKTVLRFFQTQRQSYQW